MDACSVEESEGWITAKLKLINAACTIAKYFQCEAS